MQAINTTEENIFVVQTTWKVHFILVTQPAVHRRRTVSTSLVGRLVAAFDKSTFETKLDGMSLPRVPNSCIAKEYEYIDSWERFAEPRLLQPDTFTSS